MNPEQSLQVLKDLIHKVQHAEGPDRILDVAIFRWLNPTIQIEYIDNDTGEISFHGKTSSVWAPEYTGDVNAALSLIRAEPDMPWVKIEHDVGFGWTAWVDPCVQGYGHKTLPLTITYASLKAIEHAKENPLESV